MSKSFIKSSAILFLGSMIGNAGAYFFHLALGRILSPAQYALLGGLLSVYMIMSTPLSAFQYTMAKLTALLGNDQTKISGLYYQTIQTIKNSGLIAFVIFIASSFLFVNYFNLDGYSGVVILSLALMFLFQLAWNRGVLQGTFAFTPLSISLIIEGIAKLLFGVLIGYFFHLANFTIASITLSLLVAHLITTYYVNRQITKPSKNTTPTINNKNQIILESIRMFLGNIGILFFISIDVLMANKYLGSDQAGLYTALSTLGKIVYFAPYSIAMALFPFTSQIKNIKKRLDLTKKALTITIFIVGIALILYFAFPQLIFGILFGNNYSNPGVLLGLVGLAIGVIGIVQIIVNYLLSREGWNFIIPLFISAIFQVVLYSLYHQNINQFVTATLASATVMLLSVSLVFILQITKK